MWHTMENFPKNTDLLLRCELAGKRGHRASSKYMVGRYETGLEFWDLPYTQYEPVEWTEIPKG